MKHLIAAVFAALLLMPVPAFAVSKIELEAPDQAKPGTMSYEVSGHEIRLGSSDCEPQVQASGCGEYVAITLRGDNGETRTEIFAGPQARPILAAIARSEVAIKNIERFLLRQLKRLGRLDGTVPD